MNYQVKKWMRNTVLPFLNVAEPFLKVAEPFPAVAKWFLKVAECFLEVAEEFFWRMGILLGRFRKLPRWQTLESGRVDF